jgi:hypothetical protein
MPTVGARVTVAHLHARVGGAIEGIEDEGRTLTVATDDGERLTFRLSRATGQFVRDGDQTAERLLFSDP